MKKVAEKLESTPGYKPRTNIQRQPIPTKRPEGGYRSAPYVLYPDIPPLIPPPDYYEVIAQNVQHPKTIRDEKQKMRTQLPIGISVCKNGTDGIMSVIMEAKTLLDPTPKKRRRYTTSIDNQRVVTIEVKCTS